jgi:hypothetical protein
MNNGSKGTINIQDIWARVQQRPVPWVIGILVVALLVMAVYPSFWVVLLTFILVAAVLYPTISKLPAANQGNTTPNTVAPTAPRGANLDLGRLHGKYLDLVQRALGTRRRVEEAVAQTSDAGQRSVLADAIKDLPELTENIYVLACKAQGVQEGVGVDPLERLAGEVKQLEASIKATNDEFQKSQYYAAMDGKLQQMQNMTDVTVAVRRWDAQIENAVSTLDTLLSQVLRIKSSEVLSYTGATDDLSHSLRREVDSLKATADAMDNVYGWQQTSDR